MTPGQAAHAAFREQFDEFDVGSWECFPENHSLWEEIAQAAIKADYDVSIRVMKERGVSFVDPSPLSWTSTPPKEPGWWWRTHAIAGKPIGRPVCELLEVQHGEVCYYAGGAVSDPECPASYLWAGPIAPPAAPPQERPSDPPTVINRTPIKWVKDIGEEADKDSGHDFSGGALKCKRCTMGVEYRFGSRCLLPADRQAIEQAKPIFGIPATDSADGFSRLDGKLLPAETITVQLLEDGSVQLPGRTRSLIHAWCDQHKKQLVVGLRSDDDVAALFASVDDPQPNVVVE